MKLPIYAYGQPVLKQKAGPITADYPDLSALIANMWETMYEAQGVGLAAPQIGLPIRLFIVDTTQMMKKGEEDEGIKQVFINAEIIEESGELWSYEEGCLSIPDIRGEVQRKEMVHLRWQDESFMHHQAVFSDIHARVIQHEYDHIEGRLFIEYLKPVKKRLIQRRLENIRKGHVATDYRMKFAVR